MGPNVTPILRHCTIMPQMEKRFVMQLHTSHGRTHYDLMLEHGAALATRQLPHAPDALSAAEPVAVTKLSDHRMAYPTYEGPVSRGRGRVAVFGKGTYKPLAATETLWLVRLAVVAIGLLMSAHGLGWEWTWPEPARPVGVYAGVSAVSLGQIWLIEKAVRWRRGT
jgi:hypothetical protein